MNVLVFSDRNGEIGRIVVHGSTLVTRHPGLRSLIQLWRSRGLSAAEFAAKFDGWSNGYVWAELQPGP